MSLSTELANLQPKNPKHQRILDSYHSQAKTAELLLDIRDHAGMRNLEQLLVDSVNGINARLLSSEVLTEMDREKLLTDRQRCEWFIDIFPNQESILKRTKEFIDKYNRK